MAASAKVTKDDHDDTALLGDLIADAESGSPGDDATPEKDGAAAREPDSPSHFRMVNDSSSHCDAKQGGADVMPRSSLQLDLSALQDVRLAVESHETPQHLTVGKAELVDYGTDDVQDGMRMRERQAWRPSHGDESMMSPRDRLVSTDRSHLHEV